MGRPEEAQAMSDTPDSSEPESIEQGEVAELTTSAPGGPRRRRALWAALSVLAIAVGAVAVVSNDDDADRRLPLSLGAAGGSESDGRAAAPAADMAMMAYVHYTAGEDLPQLGGSGTAYKLAGGADEDDVRALADALGMAGDPVHEDGYWNLESGDAQLQVYEDGGGSWWFNAHTFKDDPGTSSGGGSSAGSPGCAPDDQECLQAADEAAAREQIPVTTTMTTPTDLPTSDEAKDIALRLLADTGVAVESAEVTVDGPYDGWYVTVEPRVEGLRVAGLTASATIGSKGEVLSAGGVLAEPERVGDYPTIDTREAIDRLNEGTGYWSPYGIGGRGEGLAVEEDAVTTNDVATDDAAASTMTTDVIPPTGSVVDPDSPIACATDTPAVAEAEVGATEPATDLPSPVIEPCGPYPTEPVEPQEVVLHEAERILVLIGANDGSGDAYLVPGYRMRGDDEWVVDVPAVDDESLLPSTPVEPTDDVGRTEPAIEPAEPMTVPGVDPG
jgi:hypothetical protein